jgi:hypothetical protein
MKFLSWILYPFLLFADAKPTDCNIKTMLPFDIGSSILLNKEKIKNLIGYKITSEGNEEISINEEKKSVFKEIQCAIEKNDCYTGYETTLIMKYNSDTLFYYVFETKFAIGEYDKMLSIYRTFCGYGKQSPSYKIQHIGDITNANKKEKIGESTVFYNLHVNKIDELTIDYETANDPVKGTCYTLHVSVYNFNKHSHS